jgi:hypothetical protein
VASPKLRTWAVETGEVRRFDFQRFRLRVRHYEITGNFKSSLAPGSTPLNRDEGGNPLKNAGPPSIPASMVAKPCPRGIADGPANPILP